MLGHHLPSRPGGLNVLTASIYAYSPGLVNKIEIGEILAAAGEGPGGVAADYINLGGFGW